MRSGPSPGRCTVGTTGWWPTAGSSRRSSASPSPDLFTTLTAGTLGFVPAALPRAALVVEDRYSELFKLRHARPATVADGLAEPQVRSSPILVVFCETRALAEDWTYRYLAAARTWANSEADAAERLGATAAETDSARPAPEPTSAEIRAWAQANGIEVPAKGRIRREVWDAWRQAVPSSSLRSRTSTPVSEGRRSSS